MIETEILLYYTVIRKKYVSKYRNKLKKKKLKCLWEFHKYDRNSIKNLIRIANN